MISTYKKYTIEQDLSTADFRLLLDLSLKFAPKVSLIVRDDLKVSDQCKTFLEKISSFLITSREVGEWPGTKLYDGKATQYIYKNSKDLIDVIKANTSSYLDLVQPDFPEDLTFLRQDETPWFVSIGHEESFWFNISEDERKALGLIWGKKLTEQNLINSMEDK